jgi:hypothetical protein
MTTFDATTALTLAAEAEDDERNATPGPWRWGDWRATFGLMESDFRLTLEHNTTHGATTERVPRNRGDGCTRVLSVEEEIEPGDALAISRMRNRNPQVASMLRAAVARVEELEKERDNWRDHCQAISDLFDPLHHKATSYSALIVAKAAKEAHLQVRAQRDKYASLLAECCDIASDIATNGDHRFRSDIDKSMDRIAEIRREVLK